ncbi:MAG: MarR family winged helix-turn-helix transcriptional regulator [Alphaproteobacteria bacterium]
MNPHAPNIDGLAELEQCTCLNLRQAARTVTQHYEAMLDPVGIKITQLPILAALAGAPLTMNQLADRLVMDRTTLTRNLRPLERQGMLRIERGYDKRERHVQATEAGIAALRRALPIWKKAQAEMVDALGRFQWGVLMDNLRATVHAAKAKSHRGRGK